MSDNKKQISVIVDLKVLDKAAKITQKKLNKSWTTSTTDIITLALNELIENNK